MSTIYLFRSPLIRKAMGLMDLALEKLPIPRASLPSTEEVRRILVIKPDHLGDVFMAASVLPLIRNRFPGARIDFVACPESAEFLKGDPLVGKVHLYEHFLLQRTGSTLRKALRHVVSFYSAARAIRQEKYDLCLLLRSHFDNGLFLALFGRCRFIVGHGTGGFGPLMDRVADWREGVHEMQHALEVLETVGIPVADGPMVSHVTAGEGDIAAVERVMGLNALAPGGFVILHPGTGNPAKQWGAGNWRDLAKMLVEGGHTVVLTGSRAEANLTEGIAEGAAGVVDLSGQLTVRQLAIVIGKANRLVCLDSLSAHLGSSSGTETFVIYSGISDPARWAPVGPHVHLLSKEVDCAPCQDANGCATMHCLDLSPEEVFRAIGR